MIYLDYSATTPVEKEVLDSFNKVVETYVGNANSIHDLGYKSNDLMNKAIKQTAELLNVGEDEVIFTSGATEANNLAIKGIVYKYKDRGKHIVTTKLEHSSVSEVAKYLSRNGFEVDYVNLDEDGLIDINHLKSLIREDTILVSICMVNSEIGLRQEVEKIGDLLDSYPKVFFHVDGTQAVGKVPVNLQKIDLFSFSTHKFYGLKGSGFLIKKAKIMLEPILHGGKSQSDFRAGTPDLPLIVSSAKALRLALLDLEKKYNYVLELNKKIKDELNKYRGIVINSNDKCIPHILNISLLNVRPEVFVNALSKYEIYISTQSACSRKNELSKALLAIGKDRDAVLGGLRISLSYKTTKEEVDEFLKIFKKEYEVLNNIKGEY